MFILLTPLFEFLGLLGSLVGIIMLFDARSSADPGERRAARIILGISIVALGIATVRLLEYPI